ncbi:MAG: fasciclin domain-containing protein [Bacteroidota bacterium]
MKKLNYLFALALLFAFACGGGASSTEETATEEATEESTTEEASTEEPAAEEAGKDIVALAAETDILSTLVTAVQAGELVETLQGEGPFTVFAPTNEAFAALPEGTLDDLLKPENKEKLVAILTYHVVSGKVMSTDLSDGMTAATVNGAEVTITTADGAKVNGASVVSADVEASNGVVHVIDAVILPPTE